MGHVSPSQIQATLSVGKNRDLSTQEAFRLVDAADERGHIPDGAYHLVTSRRSGPSGQNDRIESSRCAVL
jgi:hypothetical protein